MDNKRVTVQIGDVFQILTSEGICYGQVINRHPKWKSVVAIFREFYSEIPTDFFAVVSKEPQFISTFLIQEAVSQGLFSIVSNVEVKPSLVPFPVFRSTNNLKSEGTTWFFWDGTKEWRVTSELTAEEKKYPKGPSLPSAPLLIQRIEENFRVEIDYI